MRIIVTILNIFYIDTYFITQHLTEPFSNDILTRLTFIIYYYKAMFISSN